VNVLGFHIDGKIPNFALAQLHAMHLARGDLFELRNLELSPDDVQPRLGDPTWDHVYGSLIFERSKPIAHELQRLYPRIELGGTGWDLEDGRMVRSSQLPAECAGLAPCYDGYPWFAHSLGWTQRGCRRDCGFCVVPIKEGKVRSVGTLGNIWRGPGHPKSLVLLDNDFFGNPEWPELIEEAKRDEFKLAVIQGVNARMVGKRQAAAIAAVPWMSGSFHRRRVYTAWDDINDETQFFRGLRNIVEAGTSPDSIMVYILIGHAEGETHADRDYRRAKLREFGARPYPMPFTREGEIGAELVAFASWCTQRIDLYETWENYWGKHGGNVRKLARATARRRVNLPLFGEDS
jgi:hypothetical protein